MKPARASGVKARWRRWTVGIEDRRGTVPMMAQTAGVRPLVSGGLAPVWVPDSCSRGNLREPDERGSGQDAEQSSKCLMARPFSLEWPFGLDPSALD